MKLYIKRIESARDLPLPNYMTKGAAGMDLFANVKDDVIIKPGEIKLIPTGIAISLPEGYEAQIRPRSGLALKHGISFVNTPGTIDSDYRGEINLIMINFGKENFTIHRGDRIAQMVINKIEIPQIVEVENLESTTRGEGGFGSTGI
ncbi:dUTP diphosphatase [Fonticella tunisiensis]|uniref:Deoxyuridine 5'-triphosphate nucleotidohydrolase n=1 Tax=Fonticella tunisiensis TaxID=1096341 RepID=A0A4R7KRX5_9CLOT|nr:dUTP diphosphatase [Fonticella tunisiensis]TDT61557.1 dUTP pyrophosphatase [Fonticella tunisiensis]